MANTTNNYITFEFKEKDRFTGKDFEIWSMRVKSILLEKEWLPHVDGSLPRPVPANPAAPTAVEMRNMQEWDKTDHKVLTLLMQCLAAETVHHLYGVTTSKEAWDQLIVSYEAQDTLAQVIATQNFYQLKMQEANTVDKFATTFRMSRARLANQGTVIIEQQAAVILLAALPPSWGPFVTAQQSRTGLTVSLVLAAMLQHENKEAEYISRNLIGEGRGIFHTKRKPFQEKPQQGHKFLLGAQQQAVPEVQETRPLLA